FSAETLKKAVKAFRHLREIMDEFGVTKYRAVATSASREAQNRKSLIRGVQQGAGIRLEVISAKEESRLGREAAIAAMGPES
ncbi:Ppx/GppA phosphatase family protein, partial [Staphylococcus aureus]